MGRLEFHQTANTSSFVKRRNYVITKSYKIKEKIYVSPSSRLIFPYLFINTIFIKCIEFKRKLRSKRILDDVCRLINYRFDSGVK